MISNLRNLFNALEFPFGCSLYSGINPIVCYETMWVEAGCIKEGFLSPGMLSTQDLADLQNMNLRYVS